MKFAVSLGARFTSLGEHLSPSILGGFMLVAVYLAENILCRLDGNCFNLFIYFFKYMQYLLK